MKRILLSIFVVGLLLVLADDLQAQERVYPFIELTDEDLERIDLHDGSVGDWLDVIGDATLTALSLEGSSDLSYDPADLDFRLWLAWHDATDRIYVAMEQADDIYVNDFNRPNMLASTTYMFTHDSAIAFVVDGNGAKDPMGPLLLENGKLTEEFFLRYARDTQWYYVLGETFDDDPGLHLKNYNLDFMPPSEYSDWYDRPPYAESGGTHFGENPTISVTEFYLTPFDLFVWNDPPPASLVSDLYPGKHISFRVFIPDIEGPRVDDDTFRNPRENLYRLAGDTWGDGLLLGSGGALPEVEDTAVESDSWGRIKASFR